MLLLLLLLYAPMGCIHAIRDAKSDYRKGDLALGEAPRRVRFHHGRGRKNKN